MVFFWQVKNLLRIKRLETPRATHPAQLLQTLESVGLAVENAVEFFQ
jgi:hypothetical protein